MSTSNISSTKTSGTRSAGLKIPLSIIYFEANELGPYIRKFGTGDEYRRCVTRGSDNQRIARKGALVLKYVIEKETLNLIGWLYDAESRRKDFEPDTYFKFRIHEVPINVVAKRGVQIGDLQWPFVRMVKLFCEHKKDPRRYIILYPRIVDGQIEWSVLRSNSLPSEIQVKELKKGSENFILMADFSPNPIPPKSINTDLGD